MSGSDRDIDRLLAEAHGWREDRPRLSQADVKTFKVSERDPAGPKTGPLDETEKMADKIQADCKHVWRAAGVMDQNVSTMSIRVAYVCEKCISYTYKEFNFVGFRLSSLVDEIDAGRRENQAV